MIYTDTNYATQCSYLFNLVHCVKICLLFHAYKFRITWMCDERKWIDTHGNKKKSYLNALFPPSIYDRSNNKAARLVKTSLWYILILIMLHDVGIYAIRYTRKNLAWCSLMNASPGLSVKPFCFERKNHSYEPKWPLYLEAVTFFWIFLCCVNVYVINM
jgi:hypothetical protein